jgi:[ribosomal protein S5]-alanine N-acetyltransferase
MAPPKEIHTPRLVLSRSSVGRLSALIEGRNEYRRIFGQRVEEGFVEGRGILEFSLQKAQLFKQESFWWLLYLMVHREDNAVIGLCGYAGPPNEDGIVEICYGIAPSLGGRGLASEAAVAITSQAIARNDVNRLRAHTVPVHCASTRILMKCGFSHVGEVEDPEEGPVWRWELDKKTATELS